jgi:ABC-type multidrug transport system ATPase subunit/pSer/pThr/pTyr-binding forkhead associated (FHA) protein
MSLTIPHKRPEIYNYTRLLTVNEQQFSAQSSIRFLTGPMAGKVFYLYKLSLGVGRDPHNDIVIFDPKVSRRHVQLKFSNGSWSVENISQNTILVNQQTVQRAVLQHKSIVCLGDTTSFEFLAATEEVEATLPEVTSPEVTHAEPTHPLPSPARRISPPASSAPISPTSAPSSYQLPTPVTPAAFAPDATAIAGQSQLGIPSLVVSSNLHPEKQVHLLSKSVISLGRDEANDITIPEPIVSSYHAQIVREGNQFALIHPHPNRGRTLNGLLFQGQHIAGDQPFRKLLTRGDIFRIGDEHGTLVTLTFHDGTSAKQERLPPIQPIPLQAPTLTIGRMPDNTVVLLHPQVSAHHARLERVESGSYRILDLNSTNHVYVNSQAVTDHLLRTGDEIRIGPFRLVYTGNELTEYDESSNIRIDALNLKKVGNNAAILLNDISLSIPPRSFVALVGGSGAGKTTLMDALNGLRPAQEGQILYNGQDYYRNLAAFNTQLGYVPQDDIVHRELTVERALYYAARLRLPKDFTSEQIQQRINEVLEDVEMTERRTLMVSKLSGGQRKRVSIALELLANPGVFFLDEPTSGLDPGLDRKMMFLLRRLADRGRTIVLVTHATNNINVCDYICFLAQGGRVAYFGPPNEAKTYFQKTDFAEIYSTLEATKEHPDAPQAAEAHFKNSPEYQRYIVQPLSQLRTEPMSRTTPQQTAKPRKRGNAWTQFLLLSLRYIELLRNDFGNLLILLLQAPVIGILLIVMVRFEIGTNIFNANSIMQCSTQIMTATGPLALPSAQTASTTTCDQVLRFLQHDPQGTAYANQKGGAMAALQSFILPGSGADAQKVLFIITFVTVLFGCINGSREIVKEAAIYRRERAVNLGLLPYMFSKLAVLGTLCLLQSAVLLLIVEIGEPLRQGIFLPVALETYITLALTSLGGLMVGLTISAIAPTNDRAISLVPIGLIPQVIFAGALIPLRDWPSQIVAVIFPTRWAMAALSSSIGLHYDKIGGDSLFGNDYTAHGTLYSTYSQTAAMQRELLSWGMLVLLIIAMLCFIGFFLKRKDVRA